MKTNGLVRFAWFVVAFTVLVILWGALVRATGSGAGCGNHWPTCQGEIVPRPQAIETVIEYSHRVSSAGVGLLAIGLLAWTWRKFPGGHRVRWGAALSLLFVIVEGAIGAMLVRLELVADNDSALRAGVIALHLANTFVLLAAQTLTAHWAGGGETLRWRGAGRVRWLLLVGLVGMVAVGSSGAIVALGDTLFPAGSFLEGWQQNFDPTSHFLLRLRWVHPLLAIGFGLYLIVVAAYFGWHEARARLWARTLTGLVAAQLLLGALNVLLHAPVWMQLTHLLLADAVWICLVLLSAELLARPSAAANRAAPVAVGQGAAAGARSFKTGD